MLKDNLLLGQYFPVDSLLRRLDARAKILITLLYMMILFTAQSSIEYLVLAVLLSLVILLSRIPVKVLWKGMRIVMFFVVFTVLFNILFTQGEVLWRMGIFKVSREGLHNGMIMGARLLFLVAFTSLLTLSTKPLQLTEGFERLMTPLKFLGIPTYEIALILSIAIRFIPTILEELERIILAQKARGADLHSINLKRRVQQLMPLMVPLFVSAFRRADELALAMEAKGYSGGAGRSRWKVSRWSRRDTLSVAFFLIIWLLMQTWQLLTEVLSI